MTLAGLRAAFTIAPWAAILLLLGWSIHLSDLKDKWRLQTEKCAEARRADSERKNNQGTTTTKNIKRTVEKQKTADGIAKTIEAAPLPGSCATPKEVLEADV